MPDDTARRREIAGRAFAARRGELGLTQEQVAARGPVALKTVQSFESRTRQSYPRAATRARLERAVGWPPGRIAELAEGPRNAVPAQTRRILAAALSPEDYDRVIALLEGRANGGPDERAV